MKALIQRVSEASVQVDNNIVGNIERGFLIFLGIGHGDTESDIDYLCKKISQLRVFPDENGRMNRDLVTINGSCLVISQFTLYANTLKGNRPSFVEAASADLADELYQKFCLQLQNFITGTIQTGIFGADMKVSLINDGPVTILIDSKEK